MPGGALEIEMPTQDDGGNDVVPIGLRNRPGQDQRWLWRQAVMVVAQLPEAEEDALAVLWYARQLVKSAPKPKPA